MGFIYQCIFPVTISLLFVHCQRREDFGIGLVWDVYILEWNLRWGLYINTYFQWQLISYLSLAKGGRTLALVLSCSSTSPHVSPSTHLSVHMMQFVRNGSLGISSYNTSVSGMVQDDACLFKMCTSILSVITDISGILIDQICLSFNMGKITVATLFSCKTWHLQFTVYSI